MTYSSPGVGKSTVTTSSRPLRVFLSLFLRDGLRLQWNGFTPYFARCGGHTVFMFLFLEQYRHLANAYYAPAH